MLFRSSFIDTVNLYPILSNYSTAVGSSYEFTINNGTGIRLQRCDNVMVSNVFCIFKDIGIHFDSSTYGTTYGNFNNVALESCQVNVYVTAVNAENGVTFTNSKFTVSLGAPLFTYGRNWLYARKGRGGAALARVSRLLLLRRRRSSQLDCCSSARKGFAGRRRRGRRDGQS